MANAPSRGNGTAAAPGITAPPPPPTTTPPPAAPTSAKDPYGYAASIAKRFGASPGVVNTITNAGAPLQAPPPPTPTDPNNNLLTEGNAEKFYDTTKNDYMTPGLTENLAGQGIGGQLNDYYEFANNKLQDQFAAQGGANSGALLRGTQELRANQAHDMESLAQAADAERLGRLSAGEGAATSADSGRLGRLGLDFSSAIGLANGEANTLGGFYTGAVSGSNPFIEEGINAGVQDSSLNPGGNFFKDNLGAAQTAVKAYYGRGQGNN